MIEAITPTGYHTDNSAMYLAKRMQLLEATLEELINLVMRACPEPVQKHMSNYMSVINEQLDIIDAQHPRSSIITH